MTRLFLSEEATRSALDHARTSYVKLASMRPTEEFSHSDICEAMTTIRFFINACESDLREYKKIARKETA